MPDVRTEMVANVWERVACEGDLIAVIEEVAL